MSEAQVALRDFERLGGDRCADQAAALLRRLGVKVVARSGPRIDGDITQREEKVLSLLGEGPRWFGERLGFRWRRGRVCLPASAR